MTGKSTTLGILAAFAFAALASISCEEDEGTGEVSSEVAPEAVADAVCSRYFACACEMIDDGNSFSSVEACELALAQDLQEAIDEGEAAGLTYNGRCPGLQADLADTLACRSLGEIFLDLSLAAQFEEYEGCKLFHGVRGPGQSCEDLDESNGDSCQADLRCQDGICITQPERQPAGEACEDTDECEASLVCIDVDGGNDNPTCEALPRGGDTCKGTANLCDIDYTCDIESKTCVALPGPDMPCTATPSVLLWTCRRGAVCDEDTDMCITAPGGGEQCVGICAEGFSCQQGRCAEDPALICAVDIGA
jgi:hypothetical protein